MTAAPAQPDSALERLRAFLARRGSRELAWSVGGSAGQMLVGMATTVLLARLLGPAGFGTVSVALAVAFTTAGLADWGLSVAFVRLASPEVMAGRSIRHLHTVFLATRLTVAGSIALAVVLQVHRVMPALQLPPEFPWLGAAAALAGVTLAAGGHYAAVLQVVRDQRGIALVRFGASLTRLVAYGLCAWLATRTLAVALAIALLAIPFEATWTAWRAHRAVTLWPPVGRRPPRAWLAFSFWAAMPAIAYSLIGQSDTVLLAALAGTAETGVWAAASRISSVILLGTGATWSVALPWVTAIVDRQQLDRYMRMFGRAVLFIGAGTTLAVIAAPWLIHLFYGAAYARGIPALRLLFAGHALGGITLLLIPVAYRFGRERLVAVAGFAEFAVNLVGDLVLIPRAGAAGSAAATLLMYVVAAAILAPVVLRDVARPGPLPSASVAPEAAA